MEASDCVKQELFKPDFPDNREESHSTTSTTSSTRKAVSVTYGIIHKFMSDPSVDFEIKQDTCRSLIELGLKTKKNRVAIFALKYIPDRSTLRNYYFRVWDCIIANQGPLYAFNQLHLIQQSGIRIDVAQRVLSKGVQSHDLSRVVILFIRVQKMLSRTTNVKVKILRNFAKLYYSFVKKFTVVSGVKKATTFVVAYPISDENSYYSMSILYVLNKIIEGRRYKGDVHNLKRLISLIQSKTYVCKALNSVVKEQIKAKQFSKAYITTMEIPYKMARAIAIMFLYQEVKGEDRNLDFDDYFEMKELIESNLKRGAYLECLHPLCLIPQRTLRRWETSFIKKKIIASDLPDVRKKSLAKEISIFMKTFEESMRLQNHQHMHRNDDIQILLFEAHQFLEGKRSLSI